jgi:hypothetical protein
MFASIAQCACEHPVRPPTGRAHSGSYARPEAPAVTSSVAQALWRRSVGDANVYRLTLLSFDEGRDDAGALPAQQVAFPVAGKSAVVSCGGSVADVDPGGDVACPLRSGLPPGRRVLCRCRR